MNKHISNVHLSLKLFTNNFMFVILVYRLVTMWSLNWVDNSRSLYFNKISTKCVYPFPVLFWCVSNLSSSLELLPALVFLSAGPALKSCTCVSIVSPLLVYLVFVFPCSCVSSSCCIFSSLTFESFFVCYDLFLDFGPVFALYPFGLFDHLLLKVKN